jgi:hypothetical protein
VGAELWVLNPFTGQQQRIALPATRWSAFGDPLEGYRYRDPDHEVGPCEHVHVKMGEIHARCSGDALDFPLSDWPQETLAAAFTLGDARVYCARFGGSVARDVPTTEKRRGSFTASQASAPDHCPLP